MKRLAGYIIGLLILFGMFAMMFVAATINDAADKIAVETFFMRTDVTNDALSDLPRKMSDISNKRIRDWLIQKFVVEYFYVVPDEDNIAKRIQEKRYSAPLYYLASPKVFEKWVKTEAEQIQKLAARNVMRTVTVFDEILKLPGSNYWMVDYELKTWYKPNDIGDTPVIERGTMYVGIKGDDAPIRLGSSIEKIGQALKNGINPSGIFSFEIDDVRFDRE